MGDSEGGWGRMKESGGGKRRVGEGGGGWRRVEQEERKRGEDVGWRGGEGVNRNINLFPTYINT